MKIKLKQAFDLQMGKTPARNRPDYWNGENKWISIADIGNTGKFLVKTKESITEAGIEGSGIKVVPQGTVIMSFKLSIGKTAITSEDMYTNEAIMAFIDNGKFAVDTDYLYHLCCGTNWTAGTNKAVMGLTLNKATLLEKEIPLPDINEQHEIATKLDKIDAIIAERQQQLELIDQLVKSRFIELFGDPKQNPKGYPVKELDEISVLITDGEHATPRRTDKGIYLLSARNILNHALQLDDVDYIDEEEYTRIARRVVPQAGDVLISCSGSIGRCCVVPEELRFQMVRSAALIRFDDTIKPVFAEWLITSDDLQRQISMSATQSSQANLFQGKIRKLRGYVPPLELQEQFAAFVEQTDKSKLAVQKGLQELEILKKSLMQQYFG